IYAGIGDGSEFKDGKPGSLAAGLKAIATGIGHGTELTETGAPATLTAGLNAIEKGIGTGTEIVNGKPASLLAGINAIISGLGDVNADGTGKKSVTTRQGKFGVIETPNTALYA